MTNYPDFSIPKYPLLEVSHLGSGKSFSVQIVYSDTILKEEVPIRIFKINPNLDEVTKLIDDNLLTYGTPIKLLINWGNKKINVPFWVWLLPIGIALGLCYVLFGDIQISLSISSIIIGCVAVFLLYWVYSAYDKYARGMYFDEALNPFLRPYELYNDNFRKGWKTAKKAEKRSRYLLYKDYID